MPATEQTWRNLGWMHVFFGVASVAMLITTIWMLAADHRAEWKEYQREFRQVQVLASDARETEVNTSAWEAKKAELTKAVDQTEQQIPSRVLVDHFRETINSRVVADPRGADEGYATAIKSQFEALEKASQEKDNTAGVVAARAKLLEQMQAAIKLAKNWSVVITGKVKFARADLDVAKSGYDLAIRDNLEQAELDRRMEAVESVQNMVESLTRDMQSANTYRQELDRTFAEITREQTVARKALDDHVLKLTQLKKAGEEQRIGWVENLLTLPIIDAFGRPLKVDQIWLPKLTINNNFRDVARFDRCTTCHQGINLTAPGSAVDPAYPHQRELTFSMETPAEKPVDAEGKPVAQTLDGMYGITLADKGLLPTDVRIAAVTPSTPAVSAAQMRKGEAPPIVADNPVGTFSAGTAEATVHQLPPGLRAGDVIVRVNDVSIDSAAGARRELLENITWGQPVQVTVRRGAAQPFSSHPRLDLFLGSTSPHDMQKFGCTSCHDGQGSATSFQWASHMPNDEREREEWVRKYGWEHNHHWIFPMFPTRFAESTCLKCHHEVVDLLPSERFPDPPAPKLMEGYNLVREYGCFGCHDINGFDGPARRIGPDLRAEPNFVAAAQQLLTDPGLTEDERALATSVVHDPANIADRTRLAQIVKGSKAPGADGEPAEPRLSADSYKLAELIGAEDETPGQFRKVGPSLRYLKSKVDFAFAYDWIRNPKHFRPSTKMPRFFGLYNHLQPKDELVDGKQMKVASAGLKQSHRFEPVEVRAIAHYLMKHSQPFETIAAAKEVTTEPSAERGKKLFETRGCLACHQHPAFPDAKADHGPNLARMGDKLTSEESRQWLYTWLREPTLYHARTAMPNLFLTPIKETKEGETTVSDPAADIAAFLVTDEEGAEKWQPAPEEPLVEEDLNDLVLSHLIKVFTEVQAKEYVKSGIPEDLAGEIQGDEVALVGPMSTEKKLEYIGRRAISKYGCFGCHDIPGYETAKPIGTGLADWGRKEPDKLAFEQIGGFIEHIKHHGTGHGAHPGEVAAVENNLAIELPQPLAEQSHALSEFDPDGFFTRALEHHQRDGFLWQKLRAPRSYDYMKTEMKDYNDRLRMPKFNFTPQQIEAVMTFVLGLLSEPPAAQYVYHPEPRRAAIIEGQKLLEKYNCGGCHPLQMAGWKFQFNPEEFPAAAEFHDYDFLKPYFTEEQLAASKQTDRRGMGQATVHGTPVVDGDGNLIQDEDENGNPLFYFTLSNSQPINGESYLSGSQVSVSQSNLIQTRPPVGGYLARLIYPTVLANEREQNPNAKESDAWGWVPPPLIGEGRKVQSAWLHDFLLDPYLIRPAAVLRMPRFNMSSQEASKLVDYFAAVDEVQYPYEYDPRTRTDYLAEREAQHPNRLDEAMKIVTNGTYCIKCHYVGDFVPEGSVAAHAPQLDRVHKRLRPDYLRDWIANPQRILSYTAMPVNFPPDKPASQELFHGTSEEQLTAIVDLLLNYDTFMKNRQSIRPLIQAAPAEQPQAGETEAPAEPIGGQ
ncbi:MAG: c-type cytochrome [Pirellulales bacterium]|nr:c-type cytochrome [Pirellulales bacterium]